MKSCCRAHIFTIGDTLKHPGLADKIGIGELAGVAIGSRKSARICRIKTLRAVPHEPIASSHEGIGSSELDA